MTEPKLSPTIKRIARAFSYLVLASMFWLGSGIGPENAEMTVTIVLWAFGGLHFLIVYGQHGFCLFSRRGAEGSRNLLDEWRSKRGRWSWLGRVLFLAAVTALFWSGWPALASLFCATLLFMHASHFYYRAADALELGGDAFKLPEDAKYKDIASVFTIGAIFFFEAAMGFVWILIFIPVVVAAIPIFLGLLLAGFVMVLVTDKGLTWIARKFTKEKNMPEGMIYFIYSESHQRAYFLDQPGVLAPFGKWLVIRNWRAQPGADQKKFETSIEAQLLSHLDITNLRKHLPFIAIIGRRGRVKSFPCNEAYRARVLDGGAALRALEENIRTAAARAFPV